MQDCTKPIHSSLRAPARVALCLPTPRFPACGALSCPFGEGGVSWERCHGRSPAAAPLFSWLLTHEGSPLGAASILHPPSPPARYAPARGPRRPRQPGPREEHNAQHCDRPTALPIAHPLREPPLGAASILSSLSTLPASLLTSARFSASAAKFRRRPRQAGPARTAPCTALRGLHSCQGSARGARGERGVWGKETGMKAGPPPPARPPSKPRVGPLPPVRALR